MSTDEAIFLVAVGLLLVGIGCYCISYVIYLRFNGFRAFAQVSSIQKFQRYDGEGTAYYVYRSLLEIIGEEGNWKSEWFAGAKILSDVGLNWSSHQEGEILEVHFVPKTDQIVSVKQQNWAFLIGSLFLGLGLGALLAVFMAKGFW